MSVPTLLPARPRAPRALLAVACLLALLAAALAWSSASAATAWILLAALLLAAAAVARVLRHDAVARTSLQDRVGQQADRLAQFAAAQSRFVDSLAHEIMTPLTIVLNHAELLLRCSDDAAAVRSHARNLADYTLHFSQLAEGFLRLGDRPGIAGLPHHVPVHANDLVVEAVRRSQSLAQSRGVHLVMTIADPGNDQEPLEVLGHETLLETMLESVVRHAVSASWRGARVELQVLAVGESILFRVQHHGLPIATAAIGSMFEWFCPPAVAGQSASGNGGELAIGKRIVEHHRGTITLHNHAEGGCEFVVTLPRHGGFGRPLPTTAATDRSSPLAGRA